MINNTYKWFLIITILCIALTLLSVILIREYIIRSEEYVLTRDHLDCLEFIISDDEDLTRSDITSRGSKFFQTDNMTNLTDAWGMPIKFYKENSTGSIVAASSGSDLIMFTNDDIYSSRIRGEDIKINLIDFTEIYLLHSRTPYGAIIIFRQNPSPFSAIF